jgi:hypothetical protein
LPGSAVIRRFENAAINLRDIKYVWLRRNSGHGSGPSTAERSDVAPVQSLFEILAEFRAYYRLMTHGHGNDNETEKGASRSQKQRPDSGIHPGIFAAAMILASD